MALFLPRANAYSSPLEQSTNLLHSAEHPRLRQSVSSYVIAADDLATVALLTARLPTTPHFSLALAAASSPLWLVKKG